MAALKLIYFQGCPQVATVRKLLKEAGAIYVEIRQEALPDGHPFTTYSSPTVLAKKQIIIGAKTRDIAGPVEFPSIDELKQKINLAKQK